MVLHDSYMEQTVDEETKNLLKSNKRIEQKGSQQLLNELIRGKDFDQINLDQLNGLNIFANEMLKKLQKRDRELNDEQQRVQILSCPSPPPQLPAQPPHDNDSAPLS
ncbi:hypothetical protein BUALT_Bualt11G0078200 [Buddleja alternifolia]|uniref:Uncharacterized protein n=1 Tax=Buddleja alternifolia TaxID=168488 RepID=A0AAV6WU92_9LAMI|nr:hypothetical protein BUALT_Bualt11G0078200 [Buddleja alternifolia]